MNPVTAAADPSFWDSLQGIIVSLGWTKGVFAIFFFMMHGWLFLQYRGRLTDRQAEINRMAAENREYRERFQTMLDNHHGVKKELPKGKGK